MTRNQIDNDIKDIDINACYAKTEVDGDSRVILGMSVFQHCRAAGITAEMLVDQLPPWMKSGLVKTGYDLIAALHDIGKISPSFQKRIGNHLDAVSRKKFFCGLGIEEEYPDDNKIHHSTISYAALKPDFGKYIAYIGGAHHGGLLAKKSANDEVCGGSTWQEARMRLLHELKEVFGDVDSKKLSETETQFLLGLTVVSDWISSSVSLREFEIRGDAVFAERVREVGFVRYRYKQNLSFYDIFGFHMRPEQAAFISSIKGPGVYVLEAGMGMGKTEAALYAAYILLASGQATGLYFALPTRLTARQMHKRVKKFIKSILDEECTETKLVFSHSFLYSLVFGDDFNEPSWFDSRKRLILAPFGVGTIDQALMSVLGVKHSALRTFGLAGKVVIIDEVHSYDAYTGTLINRLIGRLRELNATVIILSATLQTKAKEELLGLTSASLHSESYPCITRKIDDSVAEETVPAKLSKRIGIELVHDDSAAVDNAIDKALDGEYVLWIENTVADAQRIYKRFAARCSGLDVRTGLLHSRFTGPDRARKEAEYIGAFGKDGWDKRGSGGFILVGTQILEQSLDIDADVLFSRIAPVDMLLQRMGRVWRHEHPGRKGEPYCFILTPKSEDVLQNTDAFSVSGVVYSRYVLYRTLLELENIDHLMIPGDIRGLIEAVYADRREENRNIAMFRKEVNDRHKVLTGLAMMMGNQAGKPLSDNEAPRYSELETRDILLLSKVAPGWTSVRLLDGTQLDLAKAATPKEKAFISLKLEESIISVPVKQCPTVAPAERGIPLSRFIYLSEDDDERIRVLLCQSDTRIEDLAGNLIPNFFYSTKIGYYEKEDEK